jgi:hypothetical protein
MVPELLGGTVDNTCGIGVGGGEVSGELLAGGGHDGELDSAVDGCVVEGGGIGVGGPTIGAAAVAATGAAPADG